MHREMGLTCWLHFRREGWAECSQACDQSLCGRLAHTRSMPFSAFACLQRAEGWVGREAREEVRVSWGLCTDVGFVSRLRSADDTLPYAIKGDWEVFISFIFFNGKSNSVSTLSGLAICGAPSAIVAIVQQTHKLKLSTSDQHCPISQAGLMSTLSASGSMMATRWGYVDLPQGKKACCCLTFHYSPLPCLCTLTLTKSGSY